MKSMRRLSTLFATLMPAVWLVVSSQSAVAQARVADRALVIQDVELTAGGTLSGRILTTQGAPRPEVPVVLRQNGREIVRVLTDEAGDFRAAPLRGGVYEVTAEQTSAVYRLWAPQTAPPNAGGRIILLTGETVYRGQSVDAQDFGTAVTDMIFNPVTLTLGAAAAIAIPVTLHNIDNDDKKPAS